MSEGKLKYAAFISYSSIDRAWVRVLQGNLERGLECNGRPGKVFLDRVDLRSGRSGTTQLQEALGQSERLVIVATPEAVSSSWVTAEWESFFARAPDRIHVANLVSAQLPEFLGRYQRLDFENHDDSKYRTEFRNLLGDVLGLERRERVELPDLECPPTPLHANLRSDWIKAVAKVCGNKANRRAAAVALALDRSSFENATSPKLTARRLIERACGDEDSCAGAQRICAQLLEEFEDQPELIEGLLAAKQRIDAVLQQRLEAQEQEKKQEQRKKQDQGQQTHAPDLLAAYLTKVARDHENLIPLFDRRSAPLLEHVYVELKVRDDERFVCLDGAFLDGAKGRLPNASMAIQEVLKLDPSQLSWVTGRWVVLGDPGAGKTTLMRHLARELACNRKRRWVPVFESLPRLLRETGWLLDRIEAQLIRAGEKVQGLSQTLDDLGKDGRLLVLLDGLDEVPREFRTDAEALLRHLAKRWPQTPILVTSRPIGFHPPGAGFHELEVQRLDGEQRRQLLSRCLGDDPQRTADAVAAIDAHYSIRELASNPLYLTLIAVLIEQDIRPSENPAHLYDQIFKLLLKGRHKRPAHPMPLRLDVRKVLRRLGWVMTEDNRHAEPFEELESRFAHDEVLKTLARPLLDRWGDVGPFLRDLAEKTCILAAHDGAGLDWRYWHRSFREALAAEVLEQRYKKGGQEAVLEIARKIEGEESRWAEAFALLCGRVEAPDTLVLALVEEKRDLGLRALAMAPSLAPATIAQVLSLTGKWEERAKVYLQIPELLPDAHSALALINRLRRETRNGNDLYHLEVACELVARKLGWERHAGSARQVRLSLYDHISAPPADLFETVETRDGRVPLWCTIPAGRFLMGSPEDEEGRFSQEGPQHEVIVESPFRLAAVPVTQAQYAIFEPKHNSRFKGAKRPVDSITWYQAMAYCSWLASYRTTAGARLPTEEEWEYACRSGSPARFCTGEDDMDLAKVAWFEENSESYTHDVGQKTCNEWGIYDMHGNVYEWTLSPWTDDYLEQAHTRSHAVNPALLTDLAPPSLRNDRVVRGGACWDAARVARSAYRGDGNPGVRGLFQSFRVLLPFAPSDP